MSSELARVSNFTTPVANSRAIGRSVRAPRSFGEATRRARAALAASRAAFSSGERLWSGDSGTTTFSSMRAAALRFESAIFTFSRYSPG